MIALVLLCDGCFVPVQAGTRDTSGPKVRAAIIDNGQGHRIVNVFFDEPLNLTTAVNLQNYRLVPVSDPNASVSIDSINYNGFNGGYPYSGGVELFVSYAEINWDPRGNYFLVINSVADWSGNNIAPYTRVPVLVQAMTNSLVVGMFDEWNFYDLAVFDPDVFELYANTNPSTSWFGTNFYFEPFQYWGQGHGIFYSDPEDLTRPCSTAGLQRVISFQVQPTLFRRTFNLPEGIDTNGFLRCRFIVDDGMILYLNGKEILRVNVPAGPLTVFSRATSTVGPVICYSTNVIQIDNFLAGTNVIAAAVCQGSITPPDTVFGFEAHADTRRTPSIPIEPSPEELILTHTYDREAGQVVISWPINFSGYSLFSRPAFGASPFVPDWLQVSDQSNPYTNRISGPANHFFQLRKP